MDENHFATLTVAAYGIVLLGAAISYTILVWVLRANHPADSLFARALGRDLKGKVSLALYAIAIPLAYVHAGLSLAVYAAVALTWLVPDRRFERLLAETKH
jgi:uncharacterized membrane protein